MSGELIHAAPVVDELITEEGSAVLIRTPDGHRLIRLSVLGQLIRQLTSDGLTIEALAQQLELRLGSPPKGGGLALVREAVEDLGRDGLVVVRTSEAEPDETP